MTDRGLSGYLGMCTIQAAATRFMLYEGRYLYCNSEHLYER